jgi:hypothetical protein
VLAVQRAQARGSISQSVNNPGYKVMTVIIQEVYNAFKEAGVREETAKSAAEALTGYGDRFHELEREIDRALIKMTRKSMR